MGIWGFPHGDFPAKKSLIAPLLIPQLLCRFHAYFQSSCREAFFRQAQGLRAVREEMRRSSSIEPYSCLSLTMEIFSSKANTNKLDLLCKEKVAEFQYVI